MGRPPAEAADAMERALAAIRRAEDADSLRAAQATLLPLLGLTLEQTGMAVGKNRHWTSRARNRFLRGQSPAKKHGGRRRSVVLEDDEVGLLKQAIAQPGVIPIFRVSVRQALRVLLDGRSATGPVSESTVSAVLGRACSKLFPGLTVSELQHLGAGISQMWQVQDRLRRAEDGYRT